MPRFTITRTQFRRAGGAVAPFVACSASPADIGMHLKSSPEVQVFARLCPAREVTSQNS